jgi:YD repeat-containing protein
VDALGNVTESRYDAAGRVVETLAYATVLPSAQLTDVRNGTATVSTFTGFVATNASSAQASKTIYDAAGRAVYTLVRSDTLSQLAVVSERRYNALDQLAADVSYGVTIAYGAGSSAASTSNAIASANGNLAQNQRMTRYVYDVNGRMRFTVDDVGAVTEQRYDAVGQVVSTRQYGTLISLASYTEATVAAAVSSQAGARVTWQSYDAAGRLVRIHDAMNQSEYYRYDGIGQRVSMSNKLGYRWDYEFDLAGRLVTETSPWIAIARFDATGAFVANEGGATITRTAYDALGNVVSRTENADAANILDRRTTLYQYDNRGNQIRVVFPDAYRIDEASNLLVASNTTPTIEITYDALGRAVVQKDVRGNYSYKVYDQLGRVVFDIDAEGYASGYVYTVLSVGGAYTETTNLRRYSTKINTSGIAGWVPGAALTSAQLLGGALTASASDRFLVTTHDARGLKTKVEQSAVSYVSTASQGSGIASPTTRFEYDAYGQLVKESVQIDATTWANTFHYYDDLGRKRLSVDAEGYVTAWEYNAQGEVVVSVEFARCIDTSTLSVGTIPPLPMAGNDITGYDRGVSYTYDALGRKTSETANRLYQSADGSNARRAFVTSYQYDAASQTTATIVDGQRTDYAYDPLGRTITVTEAARQVLADNWSALLAGDINKNLTSAGLYVNASPYTSMSYDAFGNVVQLTRAALGLRSGEYFPTPNANDQITLTRYDRQGRAVYSRNAVGDITVTSYDEADNVKSTLSTLTDSDFATVKVRTSYTYDKSGRQLSMVVQREGTINGAANQIAIDSSEYVAYNGYGEIIAKSNASANLTNSALSAQYEYDLAGRIIRSNAEGGVFRRYFYNLAGHQQREERDLSGSGMATTTQRTDLLGRVQQMVMPAYGDNIPSLPTLTRRYDRWGNVIEQIDPRGYSTQVLYNDRNQVVREVAPLVKVLSEAGVESWVRTETRYSYDASGRLIATRDANGNVDYTQYDAAGRVMKTIDSVGAATLQAYDALGRSLLMQNPLGYLTFKSYDRLSRVVAQGDLLSNLAGTGRDSEALQSFTLNQRGDRTRVTVRTSDTVNNTQRYDFDSRGLLLRSRSAQTLANNAQAPGVTTSFAYDAQGRKTSETNGIVVAQSWNYDYFGRLSSHVDLSNKTHSYVYDARSGLLSSQSSTWDTSTTVSVPGGREPGSAPDLTDLADNRSISYYANGLIKRIDEPSGIYYRYEYDAAGNRTLEETKTYDGRGFLINRRTQTIYDSHGRVSRITEDTFDAANGAWTRVLDMSYDYDAVGNRRRVTANSGYGPVNAPLGSVNLAPVLVGSAQAVFLKAGAPVQWRLPVGSMFRDPEGKPLSINVSLSNGAALPSWLTVDTSVSGEIQFVASSGSSASLGQTFAVRVSAVDDAGAGATVSTSFNISVVSNSAPTTVTPGVSTIQLHSGLSFDKTLLASSFFADREMGDKLSLSVDSVSPWASWLSIDMSSPQQLRIRGTAPAPSSTTIRVRATDQNGASVVKDIVLQTQNNVAPAVAQSFTTQEASLGRAFVFSRPLEQVFTDANADLLTVSASLSNGAALPAWLSFEGIDNPPTLRLVGVVPPNEVVGTQYQVRLTASDGFGGSVSTIVTVAIVTNRAPTVIASLPAQNVAQLGQVDLTFSVAAYVWEPDGNDFTMTRDPSSPSWLYLSRDAAAGTFRIYGGVPGNTPAGSYVFNIQVADAEGATTLMPITINVSTSHAPVYTPGSIPATLSYPAGQAFSYTLPANAFTDADAGQILTYSAVGREWFADPDGNNSGWIDIDLPPGVVFNGSTLSGTPSDAKSYLIAFRATDPTGQTETSPNINFNVTQTSANVPPTVANAIPSQSAEMNSPFSYTIPANTFIDGDNDPLTYSASNLPGEVSFNPDTRVVSGVFTLVGSQSIIITANDGRGGMASTTLVVNVTNADANVPPRVNVPLEDQSVYIGDSISYTIPANSFVDDNGDALTYTATGMPSWFVFDPSTRRFSGVSRIGEGEWVITVTVTDGRGGSASDAFMLYTFNPNVISEAIEPPVQKFESLAMVVEGPPEMPPEMPPEDPTPDAILLAGYADGGIQVVTAIANVTVPVTTYTVGMGVNRQEHWYTYDAENRVVISQGALKDIDGAGPQAPRIVLGDFGSHEQRYDVIGQMVALVQYGTVARTQFNLRGQRVSESAPLPFADSGVAPLERREFDDAGRVTQVKRYYAPGSSLLLSGSEQPAVYGNAAGLLLSAESYTYDLDGRVKEQVQSSRVANWQNDIDIPLTTFNSDATFRANQTNNLNVLTQVATVKYTLANNTTSSYDAAGRLLSYRFIVSPTPNQSGSGYTHTFSYTYEARDSYLEKSVTGVRDNMTGTTTSYYDAYGRRVAIQEVNTSNQTIPKLRYFSYNADGQILSRRDGNGSSSDPGYFVQYGGSGAPFTPPGELPEYPENPIPHIVSDETWTGQTVNGVPGYTNADRAAVLKQQLTHRYHYANGQQIAETTQSGQLEVVRFLTSFSSSAMGTQSITVQSGDTLQAIAQRAYGNSSLWYVIASANGVTDAELVEGTQLKVPEVKTNLNDAATFKPYDPSEISGPTTPTLPFVAPPAPNSCLMVVVVIVAIIVTIYTAGAAAGLLGATGTVAGGASTAAIGGAALTGTGLTVATGATVAGLTAGQIAVASAAIGAFVGSVASQLVGKALGVVDHFSLRQATASGLTAGITAGVGSAGFIQKIAESATYGHIAAGAVSSATSAVTSYAANRIAGVDTSFSWKSIAASAVSGAVTAGIGAALPITNTFGKELANRLIGGVVGLHARRAFGFDDPVNYESVAADAFGNALGNAAVRGIQNWWANRLASQGSFLDRYPQATASGYGEQRGLFASEPDTMSTDGSVVYGEGHTRRATDEELYQWQADIDALSAQGRDMTVAQQALDEMWTRRYAELGIPMLEPVTVVGNVTSAAGDTGANAADASLMWLHSQFENLRSTSRDNILNANSAPEAMLASGVYAVNEVTSAVASGFVDVGRLITSPQMRADAWRGLKAIAAHPIDGLGNAWKAWQDLPPEERLRQGGAMLATLGTGAITGPSKLGTAARVTDEVSTLVARETEALAEIAARNATAEAKSLHARINARAPNTSVETTQPTAAKPHFRKFSFDNVDDFNRAANKALPNSRYEFGGNVWITDSKGRVARIEASALLKAHGRHETIGEISARQIGHEGTAGDIGFHLFADQFGGPVNRLNVVPGNGRAETLPDGTVLKNLNGSDYKVRFENRVAEIGRATEKPVAVKIEPGYLPGNFGSRPDIISASYQLRSGKWVVVRFNNKAGG